MKYILNINSLWTVSPLGYSVGEGRASVSSLCSLQLDVVLFASLLTKLAVGPHTHPQGLSLVRVAETVVKGSKCYEIPLR